MRGEMPVSEDSIPKNEIPEDRAVLLGLREDERDRFNKSARGEVGESGNSAATLHLSTTCNY